MLADGQVQTARWRHDVSGWCEHVTLERHQNRITVTAVAITDSAGIWYQMFLDERWRVKAVSVHNTASQWFIAKSPEPGHWRDGDGRELKGFAGCSDFVLSMSPFAVSPLIHRLKLKDGAQQDLSLMQLSFAELEPVRVNRQMTCVSEGEKYLLDNPLTSKSEVFNVDLNGLVTQTSAGYRLIPGC